MEIFKITCGQIVLISDEDVTEITTNNNLNAIDMMEIYRAIVTPRNNVSGYINGPSVAMQGLNSRYKCHTHTSLLLPQRDSCT